MAEMVRNERLDIRLLNMGYLLSSKILMAYGQFALEEDPWVIMLQGCIKIL
jgi:hypothetical protein